MGAPSMESTVWSWTRLRANVRDRQKIWEWSGGSKECSVVYSYSLKVLVSRIINTSPYIHNFAYYSLLFFSDSFHD